MSDPTKKRQVRRNNHIAKDLRTPKYRERSVPKKTVEEEDERRFRRYHTIIDDVYFDEPWHPLDRDNENNND